MHSAKGKAGENNPMESPRSPWVGGRWGPLHPGGHPRLATVTRRPWAMLVPSTARLYTGSSERPHGEGIHAMLQG